MKIQISQLIKISPRYVGLFLISTMFLLGCQKDPKNNTPTKTPIAQEDLSLISYIIANGDTFRGAYNAKILDTNYLFESKRFYVDSNGTPHNEYSYVNRLLITWYGSNQSGTRVKDTQIQIIFSKRIASLVNLKSSNFNMFFDNACMKQTSSIYFNFLRFYPHLEFPEFNQVGMDFDIEDVFVDGNWGPDDRVEVYMITCNYEHLMTKTSFKLKKLSDGKFHRVFESEYYSDLLTNIYQLIPVKVRIVLD